MERNLPNRKLDKWSELEEREIINGAPDILTRMRFEECKKPDKWTELEERQIINGATDTAQWSANKTYSKWAHTHRSRRDKINRAKPARLRPLVSPDEVFPPTHPHSNFTRRPLRLPPLVRPPNEIPAGKPYYVNSPTDKLCLSKTQSGGKLKSQRRRAKAASPMPCLRPREKFVSKFEDIEDVVFESPTPDLTCRSPSTQSLALHRFRHDSYPYLGLPRTMSSTTETSGKPKPGHTGTRKVKTHGRGHFSRIDKEAAESDFNFLGLRHDAFEEDISKRRGNNDT